MFTKRDVYSKPVKLQHRHFVLIADIIRDFGYPAERRRIAEHFANRLARTNPNFDRSRFVSAAAEKD